MPNETVKTVLWVEDNAQDTSLDFIPNFIDKMHFKLREASGVAKLARELVEIQSNKEKLSGIILDMLIYGASDLSPFGIQNVAWDHDATDVGKIILKHIFRNSDEKFSYLNDIPILILTVKPNVNKSELKKYKRVEVAHKYDDGNPEWEKIVEKWISKL